MISLPTLAWRCAVFEWPRPLSLRSALLRTRSSTRTLTLEGQPLPRILRVLASVFSGRPGRVELLGCLSLLSLVVVPAQAQAQYQPSLSWVRESLSIQVNRDGSNTQVIERVLRVETEQGIRSAGEQRVSFNSALEDVEVLEAYTLQPDGSRVEVATDKIRTQDVVADGDVAFSDEKVKVIIFAKVAVGSLLGYRFKSTQHTAYFPGHFFQSEVITPHYRHEDFSIDLTYDPGLALQMDADRMLGGPVPSLPTDPPGSVRHRYTYREMQAHPPESGQLDLADFAPHLLISSFAGYPELAKAYQARAKPKAGVSPAIAALSAQLVAGAADERDKVRRLYNWVARNIRYVSVSVGAGGYVPHEAQSVLELRYGDCKDHVVLLEALLDAAGIASSAVLINTEDSYRLPKLAMPSAFDHAISYVPSLDLYLDSTAEFAPMGMLPNADMAKPVLLTALGRVGMTPATDPAKDYTSTELELSLQPDGGIVGKSRARLHGYLQVASRSTQQANATREQAGVINRLLARFMESGTGKITPTRPGDLDAPWLVQTEFELDPVVNVPGPSAMTLPAGLSPGRIKGMLYRPPANRRFPSSCQSVRHVEAIALSFPASVRLGRTPQDVNFGRGALEYSASYRLEGQLLKVRREFVIRRSGTVCGPSDDRDWEAFQTVLQRDMRAQVFFE